MTTVCTFNGTRTFFACVDILFAQDTDLIKSPQKKKKKGPAHLGTASEKRAAVAAAVLRSLTAVLSSLSVSSGAPKLLRPSLFPSIPLCY